MMSFGPCGDEVGNARVGLMGVVVADSGTGVDGTFSLGL